ncbi:WD40-repeat-containing domain protein [Cantharellus anzutake]|uniref:WD40-repeat-containing domain protein n=1 Tax=Cantharellus anzutake TaxID=1750568 RepID=UPI001906E422|nr:WD40-repeat-containing domain protein [Cantharellus anzutake]KAF8340434.1 WD40-repeat-containing domain protein [Cantharellus anzutake]
MNRIRELAGAEFEDADAELKSLIMASQTEGDDLDDGSEWEDTSSDPDESNSGDMEVDGAVQKGSTDSQKDPNDISEYQLDTYDDEEGGVASGPFSNMKWLLSHDGDDPYVTLKEDEAQEREEAEIYPTDNLIVVAKVEADVAQMEVFVYDESKDNLYAHHDFMLPSFPLCIEWLDYQPNAPSTSKTGNFIAVGTFEPEIEIWSLDTMDAVYPDAVLGKLEKTQQRGPVAAKPNKRKKAGKSNDSFHIDSVLGLSWNKAHRNLLASASADKTVKLWDLSGGSGSSAIRSYNIHQDKVQTVHWCPNESTVLLTGGLDHTLRMFDTRAPTSVVGVKLNEEIEVLRWDPWDPSGFYVALKDGSVRNFDARTLSGKMDSAPRFNIAAHHGSALGLDVNPHLRGCIATGGHDEIVKVWDVKTNATTQELDVSMVASKELGVGKAFSVTWSPDDPLTLAAGGSTGKLQVWDVSTSKDAFRTFKSKLYEAGKEIELRIGKSEVIGVDDDDDDDENDDDADPTSAFGM